MTVIIDGEVVNEHDIYECDACEHIDAVCAYHLGVNAGVRFVADFLADFGNDPEVYLAEAWKRRRIATSGQAGSSSEDSSA